MDNGGYKVFVSHGAEDTWVAGQIAKCIHEVGALTFLDETNIPKGANFKEIIHKEIASSEELVAFITPWSAARSWMWIEMGAAWGQNKPVIGIFYGITVGELEGRGQGKAILEDINVVNINAINRYLLELQERVKRRCHV